MLNREELLGAIKYNAKRTGKLYNRADLPWPWNSVDAQAFAFATAQFQSQVMGCTDVDGKLGPVTLKELEMTSVDTDVDELAEKPTDVSDLEIFPGEKLFGDDFSAHGVSNAIVVNGAIIQLPDEMLEVGVTASNYLLDEEPRFKHRKRRGELLHFVLHETAGNTAKGCKNTLLKKGYGAQLILSPSGHLSCHGDLLLDRMIHANQLNETSFGIEVVNPYSPIYVIDDILWSNTIDKQWWTWIPNINSPGVKRLLKKKGWVGVPRKYVTPTDEQMRAIKLLVPWLCEITGVPYRFPTKGLNKRKRKIDGINSKPRGRPGPGVVEHRSFALHADGRYILEALIAEEGK